MAIVPRAASGQTPPASPWFVRRHTFGFFAAYSNDSSPMLLGTARDRKLLGFGAVYNRRILGNRAVNWEYSGEILPVALESDPVQQTAITYTVPGIPGTFNGTQNSPTVGACREFSGGASIPGGPTYSFVGTCTRRWVIGQAMSPVGFQWNFLPHRRQQPFLVGHGGYMYSTKPVPVDTAGSFNFTFDLGVGVELFRSPTRSLRAEYRYHHISNDWTAQNNPGVDSGLFQVTYAFGH